MTMGEPIECMCKKLNSCEVDPALLKNLNYTKFTTADPSAHLMVSQEAHAFKFADRVVVNFQCSIQLDVKKGECPVSN